MSNKALQVVAKVIHAIFALIIGIIALMIVNYILITIGGQLVALLNLPPGETHASDPNTIVSVISVIISCYVGIKVYKIIVRNKHSKKDNADSNESV